MQKAKSRNPSAKEILAVLVLMRLPLSAQPHSSSAPSDVVPVHLAIQLLTQIDMLSNK